jgi:pyrroline-5-carboxylate reductase
MSYDPIAILGGGNLGRAIARGLVSAGACEPGRICLTRRTSSALAPLAAQGFLTSTVNADAVRVASVVLITVRPKQLDSVLDDIKGEIDPGRHVLISTVTDAKIGEIRRRVGSHVAIVRAMPNIGVAVGQSMTCLACGLDTPESARKIAASIFDPLGVTTFVEEEQMTPATALCACGIAFFLRAIRAASQGGVQVGFHADEAIRLAAQTAKGAADLILTSGTHPEPLIDTVTTPLGVTIAGLNEMEHHGFSSAFIRGIVVSAEQARLLYAARREEND